MAALFAFALRVWAEGEMHPGFPRRCQNLRGGV